MGPGEEYDIWEEGDFFLAELFGHTSLIRSQKIGIVSLIKFYG